MSGLAIDNNDALSRRDQGLEFLDVSQSVRVEKLGSDRLGGAAQETYRFTNTSGSPVDTHLLVIVHGITGRVRLANASGTTHSGDPYIRVFLPGGVLQPGQQITQRLVFNDAAWRKPSGYTITLLSGQGAP